MDIEQLRIFCRIVEKKSFSQAAEIFHLTQPAVSFQVQSLEKHFEVKLFDRLPRGIELTPKGEVVYKYAKKILALQEESHQAVAKLEGTFKGKLIIGASTIAGSYVLPELVGKFKKKHPQVYPIVRIMDTQRVINSVLKVDLELGIVGARVRNNNLIFEKLIKDELIFIIPSSHPWRNEEEIRVEQLSKEPFIMHEDGSGVRITIKRKLKEAGFSLDDFNVTMELEGTSAIKTAVEAGLGISIVPLCAARNEIRLGQLKTVKVRKFSLERSFYFIYHKAKTLSPVSEAFLKFTKSQETGKS